MGLLRDARRDISLDQVRVLMAQLSPSQIYGIADGRIRIDGIVADAAPPSGRSVYAASRAFTPLTEADDLTPLGQMAAALSTLVPAGSSYVDVLLTAKG